MNISSDYFIYINIFVGLIYSIFIVVGYVKGFLFEIVSLFFTIASAIIAWFAAPVLASTFPIINITDLNKETELLSKLININALANTVIYFVIVFLVLKLLNWIISFLVKGLNKIPVIGKFNQILGAIVGIINATLVTLALSLLLSLPVFKNGEEIKNATIFKYINKYSDEALTYIIDNVDLNNIKNQFDNFDIDSARDEFKQWLNMNNNNE